MENIPASGLSLAQSFGWADYALPALDVLFGSARKACDISMPGLGLASIVIASCNAWDSSLLQIPFPQIEYPLPRLLGGNRVIGSALGETIAV